MDVPVHGGAVAVQKLGAVHADVAAGAGAVFAGVVGVDGVDTAEGDVAALSGLLKTDGIAELAWVAIVGPALEDGQFQKIDIRPGFDHLLTEAGADDLGPHRGNAGQLQAFFHLLQQTDWRLRLGNLRQLLAQCIEPAVFTAQCHLHAAVGAEGVDGDGHGAVAGDVGHQQGFAAQMSVVRVEMFCVGREDGSGRFAHAVGDLRDLEDGRHRGGDAVQFTGGVEGGQEILERGVGHGADDRSAQGAVSPAGG
jgi:hypothetical protein